MGSLKTCDGEHNVDAPCDVCASDDKRCDYCWEANPDDQHDDLKSYRQWPTDGDPVTLRLCKSCYRRARDSEPYDPPKDDSGLTVAEAIEDWNDRIEMEATT